MEDLTLRIEFAVDELGALSFEQLKRYVDDTLHAGTNQKVEAQFGFPSWDGFFNLAEPLKGLWQQVIDAGGPFALSGWVDDLFWNIQNKRVVYFSVERAAVEGEIKIELSQFCPEAVVLKNAFGRLYPDRGSLKAAYGLTEDFEAEMLMDDIYQLYLDEDETFIEEEERTLLIMGGATVEAVIAAVRNLAEETASFLDKEHGERVRGLLESAGFLKKVPIPKKTLPEAERVEALIERGEGFLIDEAYCSTLYFYNCAVALAERFMAEGRGDEQLRESYGQALLRRGHLFNLLKYARESLADFEKLVELLTSEPAREDTFASALYGRGYARDRLGLAEKALQDYTEAAERLTKHLNGGGHNDGLLSLIYRCRARLHEAASRPDLARADRQQAETYKLPQEKLNDLFYGEARKLGAASESEFIDIALFPPEVRQELRRLSKLADPEAKFNMFAERDSQAIYIGTGAGGTAEEKAKAEKLLSEGEVYTVLTTYVSDALSYVLLKEHPEEPFNTIYFQELIN